MSHHRVFIAALLTLLIVGIPFVGSFAYAQAPAISSPPTSTAGTQFVVGSRANAAESVLAPSSMTLNSVAASWTKYPGNPVLSKGAGGSWDGINVELASVVVRNGTYELWYTGDTGTDASGRIGYATSPDGVTWTRPVSAPVLNVGTAGTWDSGYVVAPNVIYHDGLYRMWYRGTDTPLLLSGTAVGYATSPDGINWTKHPANPVLQPGQTGQWDDDRIWSTSIIIEDGQYKMWYGAGDGSTYQIGYATSPDGIHWTKFGGNPILTVGASGTWDDDRVYYPTVVSHGCAYEMWYSGFNTGEFAIGHASSFDGVNWQKDAGNPVLHPGPASVWDADLIIAPSVVPVNNTYHMWYSGSGPQTNLQIGRASAPVEFECPPYVGYTSPVDGAGFVRIDEPIQVTFSKPMSTTSVTLRNGIGDVLPYTATWNAARTVVNYEHPDFTYGETITLSISGQDQSGYSLVPGNVPTTWSFTVTDDAPHVQWTQPANNAINVPVDTPIEVIFSKPMNTATVILRNGAGNVLPYTPTWTAGDTKVTYGHPTFAYADTITLSLEGQDQSGKDLEAGDAPLSWTFTTGANTYLPVIMK